MPPSQSELRLAFAVDGRIPVDKTAMSREDDRASDDSVGKDSYKVILERGYIKPSR